MRGHWRAKWAGWAEGGREGAQGGAMGTVQAECHWMDRGRRMVNIGSTPGDKSGEAEEKYEVVMH